MFYFVVFYKGKALTNYKNTSKGFVFPKFSAIFATERKINTLT